jgi:[protein-PII] uridylyltransferase
LTPEKLQSSSAWREIEREFLSTGNAARVLSKLTDACDAVAAEAYRAAIEGRVSKPAAMLAAGAYGRRETFPYSGADIILLAEQPPEPEPLKEFARLLWEAGLRLNFTARTIAECLDAHEKNPDLAANLLDLRFLAGDANLQARLQSRLPAVVAKHAHAIGQRLAETAWARHARFHNTCRHLEPDLKEGPGGLRDLRLIDLLLRLNPRHEAPGPALREAGEWVARARCFLHYHHARDANVLDSGAQEALARQPFASGRKPVEWMREFYRNARLIFREALRALDACDKSHGSLLDNFREYRTRLSNGEFTVSRDRLWLREPSELETQPESILRVAEFVARHGTAPSPETDRRLEAAKPVFAALCAEPHSWWPALKTILTSPHAGMALRALDDAGLLTVLFPEWAAIEDLAAPEPERRYTADEHAFSAIECVAGLPAETDPARRRIAAVYSEMDNPAALLFAILFHDIRNTAAAMARIQMPADDQAAVSFVIEHQRDMAEALTVRDLDDPATTRLLAERAGTSEWLRMLTVFTYAVIAANPEAMTPWRLERLWKAYSLTQRELTRELEAERIEAVPADLAEGADFLRGFPARYLRARSAAEIQKHLELYEQSRPTGAAVELDEMEGGYRVTVVARDRPFLFASFAGAISSFGLDILKAEAFANERGVILDTFVFADPKRMLQLNPPEMERLRDLLQRVAVGKTDARRLMRSVPVAEPRKRTTPPQVQFDSETAENATLVEIVAEDRPGLLYSLATVFSSNACNIDVVLIDTKGGRAIDVFYVAHEGHKLSGELQTILREKLLAAC